MNYLNRLMFIAVCMILAIPAWANHQDEIIYNLNIKDGQTSRVYFDSWLPIEGSTYKGFSVSNNEVIAIHIEAGERTGHFLIVSSRLNPGIENFISYNGGSDLIDSSESVLAPFIDIAVVGNSSVRPRFVDPQNGNFRLQSDSGIINMGGNDANVHRDMDGNPRYTGSRIDIGGYEYSEDLDI